MHTTKTKRIWISYETDDKLNIISSKTGISKIKLIELMLDYVIANDLLGNVVVYATQEKKPLSVEDLPDYIKAL